ncbi:trypco2 family protein [Streptomyces griseus]|uniref:trypco2 family protein n=1 Tax=Streptomyces griseus TaxID=1911 RepID=UPI00380A1921
MGGDNGITLREALRELRQELYAAQDDGWHEQFRFEVEQAELTLEVEFRRDGAGKVQVEVGGWGAKAGLEAGGTRGDTLRQTLTLRLQVLDEALGGDRAKIRRNAGGFEALDAEAQSGAADILAEEMPDREPPEGDDAGVRPWER